MGAVTHSNNMSEEQMNDAKDALNSETKEKTEEVSDKLTDGQMEKIREKAVKNLSTAPRKSSLHVAGEVTADRPRKTSFVRFDEQTEVIERAEQQSKDETEGEEATNSIENPDFTSVDLDDHAENGEDNTKSFPGKYTDSLKVKRKKGFDGVSSSKGGSEKK